MNRCFSTAAGVGIAHPNDCSGPIITVRNGTPSLAAMPNARSGDSRTLGLCYWSISGGKDFIFVGTVRPPHNVAESLYQRGGGSIDAYQVAGANLPKSAGLSPWMMSITANNSCRSLSLAVKRFGFAPPSETICNRFMQIILWLNAAAI